MKKQSTSQTHSEHGRTAAANDVKMVFMVIRWSLFVSASGDNARGAI